MLFCSMIFLWAFLPIVFVLYRIIPKKYIQMKNGFLLLASLIFYAWGEGKGILLLLASILINYVLGRIIAHYSQSRIKAKITLICGIIINLGILGFFKYSDFFLSNVNAMTGKETFSLLDIALPIGISFYTFQALSYIIDLYQGKIDVQKNPASLALYISFFPQLIAGPIVKYKDVETQLKHRSSSIEKTAQGIRRFIYGLGKKVIIANTAARVADTIYALPRTGVSSQLVWIAAISYMLQIYYDFSGYSDMAIGLGKMFGFEFAENFNYPYMAKSISEFWRRWHISMTSWFRDYIYIPLGGNRKGLKRTLINTIIVFAVTGFWHGASWNFILWGLINGLFIIFERVGLGNILKKDRSGVFCRVYTLLVVLLGWVLFRIENIKDAFSYMAAMFSPWLHTIAITSIREVVDMKTGSILLCGIFGAGMIQKMVKKMRLDRLQYGILELIFCMLILGYSIVLLISDTYNPFIYFRF